MNTTTTSTSGQLTPRNTDIKPGNSKNPGNKLYTDLIKDKKKAFVFANMHNDTKTKDAIVQSIYETIRKQSPSGRFLGKNTDGSFSIKSKEDAIRKIKKALNENKKTIENYFRFRGQGPAQGTNPTSATTKSTKVDPLSKATSDRKIKRTISLLATSKIATQESSKATSRTSSIARKSSASKPGEEKNSSKRQKKYQRLLGLEVETGNNKVDCVSERMKKLEMSTNPA